MTRRRPTAPDRAVAVFVLLLLVATAAFVVGGVVERNQTQTEATSTAETHAGEAGGGESHAEGEPGTHTEGGETGAGEEFLGINVESTPVVVLAVMLGLLLAAAAWGRPFRPVLLVGALFCLGATGLDVREVVHQVNEDREGVAALAGAVALLHLLAAAAAAAALRQSRSPLATPSTAPG